MSLVLDEHRTYLADTCRVEAFAAALRATVRPGDLVLDLASGSGILGLLACQAGARRVYALEMGSIVELAREIARANGFADRIVAIQEVSTRATLPERVDLVVMDGAGRFGFDGDIIATLSDARRRFLKPDGRIIPARITLTMAPTDAPEPAAHISFWTERRHGLTFAPAAEIARNTGYPRHLDVAELVAPGVDVVTFDPSRHTGMLGGRASFTCGRSATVRGMAGWFTAQLSPGVTLTNAPGAPARINRRNVFLPLREPVEVAAGDVVRATLVVEPAALIARWRVEILSASGQLRHTTDASTFEGMLLSREEMARTRPGFQPTLTVAGRARRTVLDLCDGAHTIAEIEDEVARRHQALFATPADAAVFVAEVVTRYAG